MPRENGVVLGQCNQDFHSMKLRLSDNPERIVE